MTRSVLLHWLLPALFLVFATYILDIRQFDLAVADTIYFLEGSSWQLRNSWLLETLMHKGGRILVVLLVLSVLGLLTSTWLSTSMRRYRAGLTYLFIAVAISLGLISLFKGLTHINCPWDLFRYGGKFAYVPMDNALFGNGGGRCFPAGHASGGYAWIALYFVCLFYWPQWRYLGLGIGLVLGLVFGAAQEFRGAHFLSHDIWTLAICWYTALGVYHAYYTYYANYARGDRLADSWNGFRSEKAPVATQ